jgi:hypothetical protein
MKPEQVEKALLEAPWETQQAEQQATINLNVARWRLDQATKREKLERDKLEAMRRGLSLSQLKTYRREQYLLRNCRATIQQLVEAHKQSK